MTRRLILIVAGLLVAALATPGAVSAGSYTVSGTCGLWAPYSNNGARMAVYADGCRLVTRNTYGGFSSPQGTEGGWRMSAPAGASIAGFSIKADLKGTSGWDAAVFDDRGLTFAVCPGGVNCVNTNRTALNYSYAPMSAGAIITRVRCYASSCTNTTDNASEPERGKLFIHDSTMTVADSSAPAVGIAGGGASTGGWKRAIQQLVVDAADNVGVSRYEVFVDGRAVGGSSRSDCSYVGRVVPCPNGSGTVDIQLAGVADGSHSLTARAVDSAGNPGDVSQAILVDNTPPTAPQDAAVVGGSGWRTANRFTVRWTNPSERFAPIARAHYELCPASVESSDPGTAAAGLKRCTAASKAAGSITALTDLAVPGEGMWMLRRLWLEDAAGNQNPAAAVKVPGLGFDATPPTDVAFLDDDPADPTRLVVRAADDASGIASGAIEARRAGETAWRPLDTRVTQRGLSALIDDELLPRGVYDLRAVAVNGAGLQQGTDRRVDGLPARIKLPVRLRSRLIAGRRASRTCRRAAGKVRSRRRCRRRLDATPRVRVGRSALLRGRLTVAGEPIGRQPLEVWRQLLGSDEWKPLRGIRTSKTGRFRYRARRGPARTIRFRYPGSAKVRGVNAPVELRVPASSSIRASRGLVVTGEYVTFRGRLRGGWVPEGGTLVELQVYTRGAWRTFAQPRARRSGRWRYQYRFETIRGRATFRFRARIRRQANYPFTTGRSRTTRVRVRGL